MLQLDPILRINEAATARGRKPSTHWADCEDGLCTRAVHTGPNTVGWPSSELAALNRARIAGKSEDEIRELVKLLHAKRMEVAS